MFCLPFLLFMGIPFSKNCMDLLKESNRLTSAIVNSFYRQIQEAEQNKLRIVVIYAGRFQPFHAGNYKVYKQLGHQFGPKNVFLAVSDKLQPPETSPLTFENKKYIISKMFPISEQKVHEVKDVTFPEEVLSHFDKQSTAFILVLSDSDVPVVASNDYFHLYVKGSPVEPLTRAGYYMPVPNQTVSLGNAKVPMNQLGNIFSSPKLSDDAKHELFHQLYGRDDDEALDMLSGHTEYKKHPTDSDFEKTKAGDKEPEYKSSKSDVEKEEPKKSAKQKSEPHPALKNVNMDTKIVNPETNTKIKLASALKYPREKKVYQKAVKIMSAAGKDRPDRTKQPIVNRAWTDRSIKRGGYGDNDEDKVKKESVSTINDLAISLAEEFAKELDKE